MSNRNYILTNRVRWQLQDRVIGICAARGMSKRKIGDVAKQALAHFDRHSVPHVEKYSALLSRAFKEFLVVGAAEDAAQRAWQDVEPLVLRNGLSVNQFARVWVRQGKTHARPKIPPE